MTMRENGARTAEWAAEATHYSSPEHYSNPESDRAVARRLIPCARSAVSSVIDAVVGPTRRRRGVSRSVAILLKEAEAETTHLEAQMFGTNEFEAQLATHEGAHEAALTEVLAAEAAHTHSESEAEALLGAALPITIRIMGGGRNIRRVTPTLARANARLVRALRQSGPRNRQLLRLVPTIQRRVVVSLRAAQRQGRPITPELAAQVVAAQAARVLSAPRLCGRGLVRNAAIRRTTVAPPGRQVRPR